MKAQNNYAALFVMEIIKGNVTLIADALQRTRISEKELIKKGGVIDTNLFNPGNAASNVEKLSLLIKQRKMQL